MFKGKEKVEELNGLERTIIIIGFYILLPFIIRYFLFRGPLLLWGAGKKRDKRRYNGRLTKGASKIMEQKIKEANEKLEKNEEQLGEEIKK